MVLITSTTWVVRRGDPDADTTHPAGRRSRSCAVDPPQRSPREHRRARVYRGLYQWDDSQRAERRERALWRVLELVCEPGSIRYRIVPGALRNAMPDHP